MIKLEKIQFILKNVFEDLTRNHNNFIDWYGFKTTAIMLNGIEIGVGINDDYSAIKFFIVRPHYIENNINRFKSTFRIGRPSGLELQASDVWYWNMELSQTNLIAEIDNFSPISQHLNAVNEIIKMIEKSSKS